MDLFQDRLEGTEMGSLWQAYRAWRKRRMQVLNERWKHTRVRGKLRFVLRVTAIFSGVMIGTFVLLDVIDDRKIHNLLFRVIYCLIAGPIIGLASWWRSEAMYNNARLDARIKSGLGE